MPKAKTQSSTKSTQEPQTFNQKAIKYGSLGGASVAALALLKLVHEQNPLLLRKLVAMIWDYSKTLVTGGITSVLVKGLTALGVYDLIEDSTGEVMNEFQRQTLTMAWVNLLNFLGYKLNYTGDSEGAETIKQIDLANRGLGEIVMYEEPPANTFTPTTYSPLVQPINIPTQSPMQSPMSIDTKSSLPNLIIDSPKSINTTSSLTNSIIDLFKSMMVNDKRPDKRPASSPIDEPRPPKKIR